MFAANCWPFSYYGHCVFATKLVLLLAFCSLPTIALGSIVWCATFWSMHWDTLRIRNVDHATCKRAELHVIFSNYTHCNHFNSIAMRSLCLSILQIVEFLIYSSSQRNSLTPHLIGLRAKYSKYAKYSIRTLHSFPIHFMRNDVFICIHTHMWIWTYL